MKHTDAVARVAESVEMPKTHVDAVLKAYRDLVLDTVAKGEDVQFYGFFTATSSFREERTGRNPQTGDAITIPSSIVPKLRPAKAFKDALNKK